MRQVDGKKLKQWIDTHGENAKVNLHVRARVSLTWIDKVISGRYESTPRRITQDALCEATGMTLDELFPLVTSKRRRSA